MLINGDTDLDKSIYLYLCQTYKTNQMYKIHACRLVTFSTVDRFNGADVEFNISLLSCPV